MELEFHMLSSLDFAQLLYNSLILSPYHLFQRRLHKDIETAINPGDYADLYSLDQNVSGLFDFTIDLKENTSNRLIITVYDEAKNFAVEIIENILIDSKDPKIEFVIPPTPGFITADENLTLVFTLTEYPYLYGSGMNLDATVFEINGMEIGSENYTVTGQNPMTITYETPIPYLSTVDNYTINLHIEDNAGNSFDNQTYFKIDLDVPKTMSVRIPNTVFNKSNHGIYTYFVNNSNVNPVIFNFSDEGLVDTNAEIVNISVNGEMISDLASILTGSNGGYSLSLPSIFSITMNVEVIVYARSILGSGSYQEYSPVVPFEFWVNLDEQSPEVLDILFSDAQEFNDVLYTNRNPIAFMVAYEETNPYIMYANDTESYGKVMNYSLSNSDGGLTNELLYPKQGQALYSIDGVKNLSLYIVDFVNFTSDLFGKEVTLDTKWPGVVVDDVTTEMENKLVIQKSGKFKTGADTVLIWINYSDTNMNFVGIRSSNLLLSSTDPLVINNVGYYGSIPGMSSTVQNADTMSIFSNSGAGESGTMLGQLLSSGVFHDTEEIAGGDARIYIYNSDSNAYLLKKQIVTLNTDSGIDP